MKDLYYREVSPATSHGPELEVTRRVHVRVCACLCVCESVVDRKRRRRIILCEKQKVKKPPYQSELDSSLVRVGTANADESMPP